MNIRTKYLDIIYYKVARLYDDNTKDPWTYSLLFRFFSKHLYFGINFKKPKYFRIKIW